MLLAILSLSLICLLAWQGGVQSPAAGVVGILLCYAAAAHQLRHPHRQMRRPERAAIICLASFCGFMMLSLLPLPAAWFPGERGTWLTAAGAASATAAELGWSNAADSLYSWSLNRAGTIRLLLTFIAATTTAFLTTRLNPDQRRTWLRFLLGVAAVVAVGGIISRWVAPATRMWWIWDVDGYQSFGCFINPNHYGGFLAMACPGAVALAAAEIENRKRAQAALWGGVAILLLIGVMASQSRGAYFLFAGSLIAAVALTSVKASPRKGIALALIAIVGLMLVATMETDKMESELRTLREGGFTGRTTIWRQGYDVWQTMPLLGAGGGGFRTTAPIKQQHVMAYRPHHAESTYFQVLAEFGLLGAALLFGVIGLVAFAAGVNRRKRRISSVEFTAGMGAVIVLAAHSLFDYPAHVPIYLVYLAGLLGLLTPTGRSRIDPSTLPTSTSTPTGQLLALPVAGLAVCVACLLFCPRDMIERDRHDVIVGQSPEELIDGLQWTPSYWLLWYMLGKQAGAESSPEEIQFAADCMAQAAVLNPRDPAVWQALMVLRRHAGDREGAVKAAQMYRKLVPQPNKPPTPSQGPRNR
jgi:O-antigen ligase